MQAVFGQPFSIFSKTSRPETAALTSSVFRSSTDYIR